MLYTYIYCIYSWMHTYTRYCKCAPSALRKLSVAQRSRVSLCIPFAGKRPTEIYIYVPINFPHNSQLHPCAQVSRGVWSFQSWLACFWLIVRISLGRYKRLVACQPGASSRSSVHFSKRRLANRPGTVCFASDKRLTITERCIELLFCVA